MKYKDKPILVSKWSPVLRESTEDKVDQIKQKLGVGESEFDSMELDHSAGSFDFMSDDLNNDIDGFDLGDVDDGGDLDGFELDGFELDEKPEDDSSGFEF